MVGSDAAGEQIIGELVGNGVETSGILVRPGSSPFTYVIVDSSSSTRTCLHTPGVCGELLESDFSPQSEFLESDASLPSETNNGLLEDLISRAWLLHCDSRHTAAAVVAATRANEKATLVSIDIEKERAHVNRLLPLCDIIFTNSTFPATQLPTAPPNSIGAAVDASVPGLDAIQNMARAHEHLLEVFPRARIIVSTLGAYGAVATVRRIEDAQLSAATASKLPSWPIGAKDAAGPLPLRVESLPPGRLGSSLRCPAWASTEKSIEVVDTTGAGDAFIGGFIHAILSDHSPTTALVMGSYVAGRKVLARGARGGLPSLEELQAAVCSEAKVGL